MGIRPLPSGHSQLKAHLGEVRTKQLSAEQKPRKMFFLGHVGTGPHLVQGFHHPDHVVENDHGLALTEPLLLDDIVLQVDEVSCLVTEVVCTEAVKDEANAFLHLLYHSTRLSVLDRFTSAVLGGKETGQGQGVKALLQRCRRKLLNVCSVALGEAHRWSLKSLESDRDPDSLTRQHQHLR